MSSFSVVWFIWQTPHTNAFSFTHVWNVNFSFDLKGVLEYFHTCLFKELSDWCKFSFLLWGFGGGSHVLSTLPGTLFYQEPTCSGTAWPWSWWTCLTPRFYSQMEKCWEAKPSWKSAGKLCHEDLASLSERDWWESSAVQTPFSKYWGELPRVLLSKDQGT